MKLKRYVLKIPNPSYRPWISGVRPWQYTDSNYCAQRKYAPVKVVMAKEGAFPVGRLYQYLGAKYYVEKVSTLDTGVIEVILTQKIPETQNTQNTQKAFQPGKGLADLDFEDVEARVVMYYVQEAVANQPHQSHQSHQSQPHPLQPIGYGLPSQESILKTSRHLQEVAAKSKIRVSKEHQDLFLYSLMDP